MKESFTFNIPPEQQAIRDSCFHPSGTFIQFPIQDVETSIPKRFEKIVRMYPNRLAVKAGDQALTYAELNQQVNRVANAILEQVGDKIGPVIVLTDHRPEAIISYLGALKAGKIVVPADPSFPLDRLTFMTDDSKAEAILAYGDNFGVGEQLSSHNRKIINASTIRSDISTEDIGLTRPPLGPSEIRYTSGSTGRPKGVVISDRWRIFQCMDRINTGHICPEDRLIILRRLTFSLTDTLSVLLAGAVLFPFDIKERTLHDLVSFLRNEAITCFASTPSVFRCIAQELTTPDDRMHLRLIILSGEPLFRSDVELYKKHFPASCILLNQLSGNEMGTTCQYWITKETRIETALVPVGYPVEGKQVLLRDDEQKQVGVNETGEIAVASRYLSTGYWNNSELTNDQFLASQRDIDGRMYLSGDIGRMLPDGCLLYVGRKDGQVKINGAKVEMGEVEAVLSEYPQIKQSAVTSFDRNGGVKYLAAYVVSRFKPAPTVTEINDYLRKKLPDYMIPSAYVFLDMLPLINGKLDRKALPKPDFKRPELSTPYVLPRNEIEEKFAMIWEETLDIHPVGIHDNFFDLGGYSLAVTRLISRVMQTFQLELPVKALFNAPTIAQMTAIVTEQWGKQLRGKGNDTAAAVRIPRRSSQESAPPSFAQERLWFLNQLEPESAVYNEPRVIRLTGSLDIEALERALNHIIARHEVLRTTIELVDGSPMERIAAHRTIELPAIDLRSYIAQNRDAEARRLIDETIRHPFNLSSDRMLRVLLLRLADNEHILVLVKHHVASDGWSSEIFWREFAALYAAFSSGQPANLPELPIQYADYAVWQREWLQGDVLETQLSYWRNQLNDLTTLELPTDRIRPAIQSFQGSKRTLVLPAELSEALRALSREKGATLFMTLLAAFQTLLSRYTGQEDIAVGSPIAGRNRVEIEGLIGFFVNTLVLRSHVLNNLTFRELLERVRRVCLGAYTHQDLPFEKLVDELQPQRCLNKNPLFQVTFQLNNGPRRFFKLPAIDVDYLDLDSGVSKFDLSLSMADDGKEITGRLQYNTDLFNADTIERMSGHFQTLLEGIVAHREQRISELPLLTDSEKHQILVEWNDTKTAYPKDKCIHQLFEEQVERTPEAVAVVFENQELTYRELNTRANQLAHHLKALGVGPEVLVGICMERSLEMVVGLLGILKAGGAHVPLDPSYPQQRLAFMLDETEAAVLVTQSKLLSQLPKVKEDGRPTTTNNDQHGSGVSGPRSRMVCLDTDWEQVGRESSENPVSTTTAENLAYVIYTSGSTGKPKGVMISHGAISNHMFWMQEALPLSESDRVLQKTPFSFDASIWEFYAPLIAGARLVMAPPRAHQDSTCLVKILAEQQVTVLQLVPSMLRGLVEEQGLESCQSLRRVFCGGEVLPFQLRERFSGRSKADLYNLYGPTEATIDVTCGICEHNAGQSVSIGRPIANTQIYILVAHLQPAPIGIAGELYIAGLGLARGYLNSPELTAEKFIPNPFSDDPNTRLYRTGDLARYRSDGNIEFLGRIDNQVKIRGFRIELGEIEAMLAQYPSIQQAVAVVREDTPGDKRLVAYVVACTDSAASASELHHFLQQKLPEYMVPTAFVFLEGLPLTPNGKLDRKALPLPDQTRPELAETYIAPRTPVEELLAQIWANVFKLDKVSIYDNFFDLGGHSLLASQVISRVRDVFQIELPVRALFEAPTISQLALRVEPSVIGCSDLEELARNLAEVELLSLEERKSEQIKRN